MNDTDSQAVRWNGPAGNAWADSQALIDELFRPIERLLVEHVPPGHVLDVGCGTGSTTVAAVQRLGTAGRATGIDISAPMLAAARARADRAGVAGQTGFVEADAQDHAFDAGTFDTVMSRFGVMFFADFVRAFTNLRRSGTPGAGLRMIVWRDIADNPYMEVAETAARPLLQDMPVRDPHAPGQFALSDPEVVDRILRDSGWTGIGVDPVDLVCTLPESELVGYFTRFGPVGLALTDTDAETRARVIDVVRPAFDPFVDGADVRFTAACWLVTARASDR
ncbi:class I SAM-dependent methyltransferase [Actinoplanes sichuanensis]|uniref:Class I SAM-dependent methyltransferase n=1 Tax=Actinoplanes sichuanensis TaxID=512349 RepID=A0ABW4A0K9_9ACTN|nr:class I SAM-dependent methyltransferase [Actinoplanes sichuanensis]BEL04361.1 class I SAM-dependent methyltransferase [Actinoplanes sichuanensis]